MKMKILLIFLLLFSFSAEAAKQKRPQNLPKRTPVYQERKKTFQKQNLPNAAAYTEVSRKKPSVEIKYEKTDLTYVQKTPLVQCGEKTSAGCTSYHAVWSAEIDCETPKIVISVTEKQKEVEIGTKYRQNTCTYDVILKHELTHVALYVKTQDLVLNAAASELIALFEKMQKESKACREIKETVQKKAADYYKTYRDEAEKQNQLIDKDDVPDYQYDQCGDEE